MFGGDGDVQIPRGGEHAAVGEDPGGDNDDIDAGHHGEDGGVADGGGLDALLGQGAREAVAARDAPPPATTVWTTLAVRLAEERLDELVAAGREDDAGRGDVL